MYAPPSVLLAQALTAEQRITATPLFLAHDQRRTIAPM